MTMISPQQEVPGTSLIPALKVSVPAVTKDQCLSESLAWVSSFDSPVGRSMRVVVAKRVKIEGQWEGARRMLSCVRRIIAVERGGAHLPFAGVPCYNPMLRCVWKSSPYTSILHRPSSRT